MDYSKFEGMTPGKWHIGFKPGPIVYDALGNQLADCRTPYDDYGQDKATALAIAALPDLIEENKRLRQALTNLLIDSTPLLEDSENSGVLIEARKALKGE